MLQVMPRDLCVAVGRCLTPSLADAELCCDTNILSLTGTPALSRVLDALDSIHELLNTCRWAGLLFPSLLARGEFAPMLARCGCPRLLAVSPVLAASEWPCRRWPSLRRGEGSELHLAVLSRNVRTVRVAVERCWDLDQPDSLGETALFKACAGRFHAGVRVLLAARASPDAASGDAALGDGDGFGWDERQYRERLSDSLKGHNPRTALVVACAWRDADTVELLLAHRADPDGGCSTILEAMTPLAAACMRPEALCVARQMPAGLYSRFEMESVPLGIVRALVAARANVEGRSSRRNQGRSPAWLAARNGKTAVLDFLLRCGASPNFADFYRDTPLHMAYLTGHLEGVLLLLDARADPNALDVDGFTPERVQMRTVFPR